MANSKLLRKVFLEPLHLFALEQIGIKEGWITETVDPRERFPPLVKYNALKSRTLLLLTLFESVDAFYCRLNMSTLVDAGIATPSSWMAQPEKGWPLFDAGTKEVLWKAEASDGELDLRQYAWSSTFQVMSQLKRKLIHWFLRRRQYLGSTLHLTFPTYVPVVDYVKSVSYSHIDTQIAPPPHHGGAHHISMLLRLHDYVRENAHLENDPTYYLSRFNYVLELVAQSRQEWGTIGDPKHFPEIEGSEPFLAELYVYLSYLWMNLSSSVYSACFENVCVSNGMGGIRGQLDPQKLVHDVFYLARTRLTDEITVLPAPRSLQEVERFRSSPEMSRFREVLGEWMGLICDGSARAEERMRRDLKRANLALKYLGHYQEYTTSPLHFWIVSVGGHIPVVSNMLTAMYTVGQLGEGVVDRRYGWVRLLSR